jgi:glyoxylase-like metal-dependent hydrolase (beta-lactamase superfamily II)
MTSAQPDSTRTGVAIASAGDGIVTLVEDKLYHLPNVNQLDGRLTTHPIELRGFACQNCYLLLEGDRALLIDTGFSVHERHLIERVATLLKPGMRLSILVIRIGEYYGICNVRPLVEAFDVDVVYGKNAYDNPALAEDFRPEYSPWLTPAGEGWIGEVKGHVLYGTTEVSITPDRILRAFPPPLRLLPTHWIYDAATKTMFTSDAFTHTWRADPAGPWTITDVDDSPSVEQVREFMVGNRFWWLPGADSGPISRQLRQVFEEFDVETIAPGYGCVLHGKDVVEHHRDLVIEVLARTSAEPPVSVMAGSRRGNGGPRAHA